MNKLPDVSNASRLANFRYWLIKLIAGRSIVILNARFDIVEQPGNQPIVLEPGIKGMYSCNVGFPFRNGKILSVAQQVAK